MRLACLGELAAAPRRELSAAGGLDDSRLREQIKIKEIKIKDGSKEPRRSKGQDLRLATLVHSLSRRFRKASASPRCRNSCTREFN